MFSIIVKIVYHVLILPSPYHHYNELCAMQVESVRELINSIDVSHIAMLRLVAELLSMVNHDAIQ